MRRMFRLWCKDCDFALHSHDMLLRDFFGAEVKHNVLQGHRTVIEDCIFFFDKNYSLLYEGDILTDGKNLGAIYWNESTSCFDCELPLSFYKESATRCIKVSSKREQHHGATSAGIGTGDLQTKGQRSAIEADLSGEVSNKPRYCAKTGKWEY